MTLATILAALGVALDMERMLPTPDSHALAYRLELAVAIVEATDDPWERRQLAKLARFESDYREDIGRCVVVGRHGDRGPWQVVPRSDDELVVVCASLEQSAGLALERIHESVGACRWLPPPDRLAVYARGTCLSEEGRRLSRVRWAE